MLAWKHLHSCFSAWDWVLAPIPIPISCQWAPKREWVMAQVIWFLPPVWKTWIECRAPAIDLGWAPAIVGIWKVRRTPLVISFFHLHKWYLKITTTDVTERKTSIPDKWLDSHVPGHLLHLSPWTAAALLGVITFPYKYTGLGRIMSPVCFRPSHFVCSIFLFFFLSEKQTDTCRAPIHCFTPETPSSSRTRDGWT